MKDPGFVGDVALELWDRREADPTLERIDTTGWARRLALAVSADVTGKPHYDPEIDARVQWVRTVLSCVRCCSKSPRASWGVEGSCAYLIGRLEACADSSDAAQDDEERMFPAAPDLAVVVDPRRTVFAGRIGKDMAAGE